MHPFIDLDFLEEHKINNVASSVVSGIKYKCTMNMLVILHRCPSYIANMAVPLWGSSFNLIDYFTTQLRSYLY